MAESEPRENVPELGPIACAAVALAASAWLIPAVVVAVASAEMLRCSAGRAVVGTLRVFGQGRWGDPASAYPAEAAAQMPGAAVWWTVAAAFVAIVGGAAALAWRRFEPEVARERIGRRPYDWRGARPRPWARPRDLKELTPRRGGRDGRFTIGRVDGRQVYADPEAHVAIVAPTRSGKTTRYIIPWLLEHGGPAIVTSTKRDVFDATSAWRARRGTVWVFDPFGNDSAEWTPLDGCENWSWALRQAQWLADATQDGDSEVAGYWRGEAAKLLAPLMHAAVLDDQGVDALVTWLDTQEAKEPIRLLKGAGAHAAARQLRGVLALDPRNRGTTFMSAGSVLAAYRFPQVIATASSGLNPRRFFDGAANTLYLIASERDQRLLAPLIVALLSSLLHAAAERANTSGPLDPTLRVLVDEAANVAPLRELPRFLSQAAGHGVRLATVWQSLGQMHERYGRGSDTILANSTTKLFMGPITDDATRRYLVDLLGDEPHDDDHRRRRPKAGAAALQQLTGDRALLVAGATPPAIVSATPWWEDKRLRVRARNEMPQLRGSDLLGRPERREPGVAVVLRHGLCCSRQADERLAERHHRQ